MPLAKAALNMLTQTMALELAQHGIRVNAIAPGYTPYEESSEFDPAIKIFLLDEQDFLTIKHLQHFSLQPKNPYG